MAYYLKYRPQSLRDLDLTKVRERLETILKAKSVPHAFLFVGPKGTGKTSSARIAAKMVNCLKPKKSGEACNKCETCKLIDHGNSMDLIEIDAASNRGIDDIRELREKIKLVPSKLKFKVYIIDEAHMLTNEAFNALLKTLEEPPGHVKFVLCTTQAEKLPDTIISRCFMVEFTKATQAELVSALSKAVKGEKLTIKDEDLKKIARVSDGSFRDAVKWLELLAATGKKISSKQVDKTISQGGSTKDFDAWLVDIYQGKSDKALSWLEREIAKGTQLRSLSLRVVERLRGIWLNKLKVTETEDIKEIDDINKLGQLINLMHQAAIDVKLAVIDSLPLELAIVAWAQKKTDQGPREAGEDNQPKKAVKVKVSQKSGKLDIAKLQSDWTEILKAMRPHNHSLEALLRAAQPKGFEGKYLVLNVYYKFHKERLEVDKYRQLVEQVLSEKLKQPVKVKYLLSARTVRPVRVDRENDNLSEDVDNDIIKTAEEIFGAKID